MLTLPERLEIALKRNPGKTQVDLARACSVKPPSVSDWFSGKTKKLEGSNLLMAAAFLNINPWWLATGKGEIDVKTGEPTYLVQEAQAETYRTGTDPAALDDVIELVALFQQASERGRANILDLARSAVKQNTLRWRRVSNES